MYAPSPIGSRSPMLGWLTRPMKPKRPAGLSDEEARDREDNHQAVKASLVEAERVRSNANKIALRADRMIESLKRANLLLGEPLDGPS